MPEHLTQLREPLAEAKATPLRLKERAAMTHGCKNCGEERPAEIHGKRLCCPLCKSYNIVCLDESP